MKKSIQYEEDDQLSDVLNDILFDIGFKTFLRKEKIKKIFGLDRKKTNRKDIQNKKAY